MLHSFLIGVGAGIAANLICLGVQMFCKWLHDQSSDNSTK